MFNMNRTVSDTRVYVWKGWDEEEKYSGSWIDNIEEWVTWLAVSLAASLAANRRTAAATNCIFRSSRQSLNVDSSSYLKMHHDSRCLSDFLYSRSTFCWWVRKAEAIFAVPCHLLAEQRGGFWDRCAVGRQDRKCKQHAHSCFLFLFLFWIEVLINVYLRASKRH